MPEATREQRIGTICLVILATVAVGASLYFLAPVLVPVVLAVFLMYFLTPVIELLMHRLHVPRPVALALTFLLGVLLLVVLWGLVSASVSQMADNSAAYEARLKALVEQTLGALPLEQVGLEPEKLNQSIQQNTQRIVRSIVGSAMGALLSILSNGALVLIFLSFLLLGKSAGAPQPDGLFAQAEQSIKEYIRLKVLISLTTGAVYGLVLLLFGVQFAVVFAVLSVLLNFIPNVGPVIAVLLPVPMVLLDPSMTPFAMAAVIALSSAVQFVSGNVVEPRFMGDSLDLHPVAIMMALVFFGMIWGIVGMFLAVPLTAVLKIACEHSPYAAPVASLLAGRVSELPGREADPE